MTFPAPLRYFALGADAHAAKAELWATMTADEQATTVAVWSQHQDSGHCYPGGETTAMAGAETAQEPDLVFRPLADVAADVDSRAPRQFLFEPVMVAGDYGVLCAEDKAGKTWGGLDAAVSCAAGMPWMGQWPCHAPGPVVVFYSEGSDAKFLRRVRAVAASKGLSRRQADALPIVPCFRSPQLRNPQHLHLIRKALASHQPALVIIDPLYLAAAGAKSSDLFGMGELLLAVQKIIQDAGASLLIAHHWNKGGSGDGHDRSSGVGPGAWGRFLISVAVKSSRTDPDTGETAVKLKWQFKGDEIPETAVMLLRRVRAKAPHDLNSPMQYSVECTDDDTSETDDGLKPAERKLLDALRAERRAVTVREIGDRIAAKHGTGLRRETCSRGLNRLAHLGLVDQIRGSGFGKPDQWIAIEETAGQ
ncbi:AAA family ATPase [Streptomyces sp. NPDC048248]|uniref:AAA family ATPase n=1 Tax=Streptomyces sp. NPDC048248 TaxID=3365523 RepID=UPI0037228758